MPKPKGGRFNFKSMQAELKKIDIDKKSTDDNNDKKTSSSIVCKFGCPSDFKTEQYLHQHYNYKVKETYSPLAPQSQFICTMFSITLVLTVT